MQYSNPNDAVSITAELLDDVADLTKELVHLRNLDSLLISVVQIQQVDRKLNASISHHFNVFHLFRITEPVHSRIIASILDPWGAHGQGDSFLRIFLKCLGLPEEMQAGNWRVTAEEGRIDILLKRELPSYAAIVIENKSNNAGDQPSQLYRYWHDHIYLKHGAKDDFCPVQQLPDLFMLIYLSPSDEKRASAFSTKRPEYAPYNECPHPGISENWIKHHQFGNTIQCWLENCLDALPETNIRYRLFLTQYLELISTLK